MLCDGEFVHASIIVLTLPNCAFEWVEADVLGVVTLSDCLGNKEPTPSAGSRCWPPPDVVISRISTEVKSWLCNARLSIFSSAWCCQNLPLCPCLWKTALTASCRPHWHALFTHQLLGKLMDEFATFFFVAVWLPYVLGCHSLPLANLHSLWACPSWQLFPSQQNASMKQQHASP